MKENKTLIIGIIFAVIVLGSAFAYKKIVTAPATLADSHSENNYPKVSTTVIGLATFTSDAESISPDQDAEPIFSSPVDVANPITVVETFG